MKLLEHLPLNELKFNLCLFGYNYRSLFSESLLTSKVELFCFQSLHQTFKISTFTIGAPLHRNELCISGYQSEYGRHRTIEAYQILIARALAITSPDVRHHWFVPFLMPLWAICNDNFTDGEVDNTEEVLRYVASHAGTTRVFSFGIGANPSRHLVQGLARAGELLRYLTLIIWELMFCDKGNGRAEFISPTEQLQEKLERQLRNALQPALSNVC